MSLQPALIIFLANFIFRNKSIHPFCEKVKRDPLETECTDDRNSLALCNLVEHAEPLPPFYQVKRDLNPFKKDLKINLSFEAWEIGI